MSAGKALVTEIQRFCTQDGPGIRTTVFFCGCPLRCVWCHNPEAQSGGNSFFYNPRLCVGCKLCAEICPTGAHAFTENGVHTVDREKCAACMRCASVCVSGAIEATAKELTVPEIMRVAERDRVFYGRAGGLTISGGEPFHQPEALMALLEAAKKAGINTAIETAGYFDGGLLPFLAGKADLLLWDVKDCDDARHTARTGVSNAAIIGNLRRADALGLNTRIRSIVAAGVNDDEKNYVPLARLFNSLVNCEGVELLPYHTYGGSKSVLLGKADDTRPEWVPSPARIGQIKTLLKNRGVTVVE